jgi:hypothetical protein
MTAWPLGHPHSSLQGPPGPVSCLRRPETLPSEKLWFCWREMVVRGGWEGKISGNHSGQPITALWFPVSVTGVQPDTQGRYTSIPQRLNHRPALPGDLPQSRGKQAL